MSGRFISDLALQNLKRNKRACLPFALSCIGTVMMFFILYTLSYTTTLHGTYGGRSIQRTLQLGVWVMLLFSVIFLFYTHSFLVKQRKKEFGLFNVLGLEKRHISRVLLVETFIVGMATTLLGVLLGALLSKLMYLIILKLIGAEEVKALAIPKDAYVISAIAFLGIHGLTLLSTLGQVYAARPVQLLRGSQLGERQPKARLWLALIGLICLVWGYYISLSVKDAVQAIPDFFKAVLLVIAGTYLLFSAGTVSLLNVMQRNKSFYYNKRRFHVIAGLRFRMNRNAVGLASICILSTMVLVMGTVTASVFAGRENQLKERFPRQAMFSAWPSNEESGAYFYTLLVDTAKGEGITPTDLITWRDIYFVGEEYGVPGQYQQADERFVWSGDATDRMGFYFIPLSDYQAAFGQGIQLQPGEVAWHSLYGKALREEITINGVPLRPSQRLANEQVFESLPHLSHANYTFIIRDDDLNILSATIKNVWENLDPALSWAYTAHIAFDTGKLGTDRAQALLDAFYEGIRPYYKTQNMGGFSLRANHEEVDRVDFNAIYGGLLFIALFLGSVFIMAMVLIIYYKQVSEGYEDQARFLILQQVGMSQKEVRQSIRHQVLMVFFLPLVMAGLHLLAAANIVWKVVQLLAMSDQRVFIIATLTTYLIFMAFYLLVYWKTAGSYYRIVRAGGQRRDFA